MEDDLRDLIIIGGGPAGLSAAIYASRARLNTAVIESFTIGGQAVITAEIENYPGFPECIEGFGLIERFKKQAKKFGTEFYTGDVLGLDEGEVSGKKVWHVRMKEGTHAARSVIVATGARPKKLGLPGEEKYRGKGVSYCAVCDGAFFKDKPIAVLGGGDTAVEEALFLTRFASKVTIVHRRDRLRATGILQERAFKNKKIDFAWNSTATEITGDKSIKAVTIKDVKTGIPRTIECSGVFVFVGYIPNTEFIRDLVDCDESGYILTDNEMGTSKGGVYACGDVRKKTLRQIVTASADGAIAAISAKKYSEEN